MLSLWFLLKCIFRHTLVMLISFPLGIVRGLIETTQDVPTAWLGMMQKSTRLVNYQAKILQIGYMMPKNPKIMVVWWFTSQIFISNRTGSPWIPWLTRHGSHGGAWKVSAVSPGHQLPGLPGGWDNTITLSWFHGTLWGYHGTSNQH